MLHIRYVDAHTDEIHTMTHSKIDVLHCGEARAEKHSELGPLQRAFCGQHILFVGDDAGAGVLRMRAGTHRLAVANFYKFNAGLLQVLAKKRGILGRKGEIVFVSSVTERAVQYGYFPHGV